MQIIRLALGIGALLLALPFTASAGPEDFDGDLIPQQYDNCSSLQNGPNQGSNQLDCDDDGYENRCDTDLDQSCSTTTADFAAFLAAFGTSVGLARCSSSDFDESRTITTADFAIFLARFSHPPGTPGPSGLSCADCRIRTDQGDAPCSP